MTQRNAELDALCVNTIRTLAIDAVQKAGSGHPGLPLGAAPMAYVLWQYHLRHDPARPDWPDRDRFVLSAGHGSMLLYALLHLYGYGLSREDLEAFRQWGSRTPGHPEVGHTAGVEATTGPLGQGSGNAVGMAVAERLLAARFLQPGHDVVDHRTYALVSDGDLMEGVSAEAGSLAGHWKLGKLVYLYDSNDVSLDGPTSLTFSEDVHRRYEAYGWQVLRVADGDRDLAAIDAALEEAKADTGRPSLIMVKTTIGFGSPNKAGTSAAHGEPLGAEEVSRTKAALGWTEREPFAVPARARAYFAAAATRGAQLRKDWEQRHEAWGRQFPELAAEWDRRQQRVLPPDWDRDLPRFPVGEKIATRVAGGKALSALAARVPDLVGGDADLSGSTKTALPGEERFDGQTGRGRNLPFGVREHAMGAVANGMALHGGVRPYAATFFCFSDYMRPSVRLAALSALPVIYVWTHDSIGLGEDGPTHQPVEHLMSLRAMPNLHVVRPADAAETVEAWKMAIQRSGGPTALVLTRQGLPVIDRSQYGAAERAARGAYVLADAAPLPLEALLIATGSEVSVALKAHELLQREGLGVRLVSMPCWEAFAAQDPSYRSSVLPPEIRARVAVEAGATLGWERWVGREGVVVGIDRFGASAPGEVNFEKLGFTPEHVAQQVRELARKCRTRS